MRNLRPLAASVRRIGAGRLSGRLPALLYQPKPHGDANFGIKEGLIYSDLP